MLKIEQIATSQTYTFQNTIPVDLTATVPVGAKVIAGGFKVENLTESIFYTNNIYINGPTDDQTGWHFFAGVSPATGDSIKVTVYAIYVQID